MSTEDKPEKPGKESAEWHRARAKSLRKNGFTKMAEELVINLNTAKALGLDVPPTLLARVDEVIE